MHLGALAANLLIFQNSSTTYTTTTYVTNPSDAIWLWIAIGVGRDIDEHRRASWAVTFEHDFVDLSALEFTRAAFDRALDIVGRHRHSFGSDNGGAQAGVTVGVAATSERT